MDGVVDFLDTQIRHASAQGDRRTKRFGLVLAERESGRGPGVSLLAGRRIQRQTGRVTPI